MEYRPDRRQRAAARRRRRWGVLDKLTLLLAAVTLVVMTAQGLASIVTSIQEESAREAAEKSDNQPHYMTFLRGMWIAAAGDGEEDAEQDTQDTQGTQGSLQDAIDTTVDISQYASDTGRAGIIYQLLDEYPEQVRAILSHYDEIPSKLTYMAATNTDTLDYVAQYLTLKDVEQEIDLSGEVTPGVIPALYQWDIRWGYKTYGDGLIGYTGCATTCLSMVAIYLTGDTSYDPATVAAWADSANYYVDGEGSAWTLLSEGCEHFGIRAEVVALSESTMKSALDEGKPLICSMGKGDFTEGGHIIVITGYDSEGNFTVNDPNSKIRTGQTWSYARLSGQIKNVWAYEKL